MHGKHHGYLIADPVSGHLYRISTRSRKTGAIDPENGKVWQWLHVPAATGIEQTMLWEDAAIGWNGLLHTPAP